MLLFKIECRTAFIKFKVVPAGAHIVLFDEVMILEFSVRIQFLSEVLRAESSLGFIGLLIRL